MFTIELICDKFVINYIMLPLFGKIMDACIINKQCHVFKFHDLLFTYKANHSTVQCVSTIKEIISYYTLNRST